MEPGDSGAPGLSAPGPVGLVSSQQRGSVTTRSKTVKQSISCFSHVSLISYFYLSCCGLFLKAYHILQFH